MWEDGQLWTASGYRRRVPPIAERGVLVHEAAQQLGFPSGAALSPLLAQRYYWNGLTRDCVTLCSRWLPVQLERRDFKPGPTLLPTYKGMQPLECWCVDLVTHL